MASRRKIFFDEDLEPKNPPNSKGKIRKPHSKTLRDLLNCDDDYFVDFIDVSKL
jgi:hypothetical protein